MTNRVVPAAALLAATALLAAAALPASRPLLAAQARPATPAAAVTGDVAGAVAGDSAREAAACLPASSQPGDPVPAAGLPPQAAQALWSCIADELAAGYRRGDKRWIPEAFVEGYRGWRRASAHPALSADHGGRYAVAYVNPVGEAAYLAFREEGARLPEGSVLALETFAVSDSGRLVGGPLFLMQKVADGASPVTGDWYYMAVTPAGEPMAMDVVTACSSCHQGRFAGRDGVAYPPPQARAAP